MNIDNKFLEGFASVMLANGVRPSDAHQLLVKEAGPIGGIFKSLIKSKPLWGGVGLGLGGAYAANQLSRIPTAISGALDEYGNYQRHYYNPGGQAGYNYTGTPPTNTGNPAYRSWSSAPETTQAYPQNNTQANSFTPIADPYAYGAAAAERAKANASVSLNDQILSQQQQKAQEAQWKMDNPSLPTQLGKSISNFKVGESRPFRFVDMFASKNENNYRNATAEYERAKAEREKAKQWADSATERAKQAQLPATPTPIK